MRHDVEIVCIVDRKGTLKYQEIVKKNEAHKDVAARVIVSLNRKKRCNTK